ncbi:hypothetical protein GCM10023152_02780 [Agromyces bauzanensis]|uniref:Uncharacterized protein n=1 Tax=Agromyces bauzanensis TaxID=1308924 RepID=A0A917PFF7_9MICO|nr:hypothetical protein GCM10011372_11170 [Agromyces bauzanensis]
MRRNRSPFSRVAPPCSSKAEALVEAAGGDEPVDEVLRHPLVRLMVHGVALEGLGAQHPQFVRLARELDEVAVDVRAGLRRVADAGEEAVQGVSELVEERLGLRPVGCRGRTRPAPRSLLREVGLVAGDVARRGRDEPGEQGPRPRRVSRRSPRP